MSKGAHGRKQWDLEEQGLVLPPDCEIIPKREILPQHEEYLINLQQKNRVIRKLKAKARDPQQLELERKEQGFSLYVNGAHSEHSKKRSPPSASRSAKTAGDDGRSSSEFDAVDRATTAPAKPVRRNWLANSINLKTSRGDQLKIRAPNAYIGSYADDFEDVEVSESFTRDSSSHEDSCDEDDEAQMTRNMEQLLGRHRKEAENETDLVIESRKVNELKRCTRTVQSCLLSDDDTEDSGKKSGRDQLLLSIADVKTLRASLQLNSSIQQSIINGESETSSGEEEVEEEEEMGCGSTGCGSMGCGTGSAEEIEEELGVEQDSLEEVPQCRKTRSNLRADDVIVLEFARPQRKEHHLLAARKTEARHTMTSSQDQRQTASSRLSTDKTRMSVSRLPPKSGGCRKPGKEVAHKTGGSQVRSSRPLSVGHRGHPSDAVTAGKQATGVMGGVGQGSERKKKKVPTATLR